MEPCDMPSRLLLVTELHLGTSLGANRAVPTQHVGSVTSLQVVLHGSQWPRTKYATDYHRHPTVSEDERFLTP